MKKIRILLTSVGGLVAPSIIRSLREERDYDFYIVGVDVQPGAVGFCYTDKSYVVSWGDAPEYMEMMLDISKKEKIDVVVPLSDPEVMSISRNKKKFESLGAIPLCSSYSTVANAVDKGSLLTYLKKAGLNVPDFCLVNNDRDLEKAVRILGYPERDIIVKPRMSRGAKGFWRLSAKNKGEDFLWKDNPRQTITYEQLLSLLKDSNSIVPSVAMEFLRGDDFNIDVLTNKGKLIALCPMKRIVPDAGPILVGRIVNDLLLEREVSAIVEKFNFSYNVNIEMAYRRKSRKEAPLIYEINPRVSGAVAITRYAGNNLLLAGILLALGKDISVTKFKEIYFQRFFDDVFYKDQQ